jgi:hypothetical protein
MTLQVTALIGISNASVDLCKASAWQLQLVVRLMDQPIDHPRAC